MLRNFFKRARRRGSNAVEFALTAPILVLIIAGTVDYGWYFHHRIALTDAVAQAAKAASFSSTPADDAEAVGDDVWDAAGFDPTLTTTTTLSGTDPDVIVSVTGTAQYTCLFCLTPMSANGNTYNDSLGSAETITHTAVHKYQL